MIVHFVKSARKKIYMVGFQYEKNGKTLWDRSQPFRLKDSGEVSDKLLVDVGQSYYWWKFRFRKKQISLTKPDSEQLRKYPVSEFKQKMDDFDRRKGELEAFCQDDEKTQLLDDIDEHIQELNSRLENLPQQLQDGHVLNEQISDLESLKEEVEGIEEEEN